MSSGYDPSFHALSMMLLDSAIDRMEVNCKEFEAKILQSKDAVFEVYRKDKKLLGKHIDSLVKRYSMTAKYDGKGTLTLPFYAGGPGKRDYSISFGDIVSIKPEDKEPGMKN